MAEDAESTGSLQNKKSLAEIIGQNGGSKAGPRGLTSPTKALKPPRSTGKVSDRSALQPTKPRPSESTTERKALKPPKNPKKSTELNEKRIPNPENSNVGKALQPSTNPKLSTERNKLQPPKPLGKFTDRNALQTTKPSAKSSERNGLQPTKYPGMFTERIALQTTTTSAMNSSELNELQPHKPPEKSPKSLTSKPRGSETDDHDAHLQMTKQKDIQNGADSDKYRSREVLNDLFHSERGTNRRVKAVAGFIAGIIIGVVLFLGLYYGLEYGIIAAVLITIVSTLMTSLCLAFTVRARCVALLMLPTLGTQRGRAAFLTIVVALLLSGPVNNIFLNANEVSNSMSCSAELAYNQTLLIQDTVAEVSDRYVMNLQDSIDDLQNIVTVIGAILNPLQAGLDAVRDGLSVYENFALATTDVCGSSAAIARAGAECNEATTEDIRSVKKECQDALDIPIPGGSDVPSIPIPIPGGSDFPSIPSIPGIGKRSIDNLLRRPTTSRVDKRSTDAATGKPVGAPSRPNSGIRKRSLDGVCDVFDGLTEATKPICEGYGEATEIYCDASMEVLDGLNGVQDELQQISDQLTISIDFSSYFDYRNNQSRNFTEIQEAVAGEINSVIVGINYVFSILDKLLLAISMTYLLFQSYQYHTNYRTKDKFDNFYVTQRFKDLDETRKKNGKTSLLPLQKTERVRLVDVTSLRLSKPEKGLFKIGLARLGVHVLVAGLIILIDNCFYWLLLIIRKHGGVAVESSGESGAELRVEGDNFLVDFVQGLFGGALDLAVNNSFDTTQCLPNGSPPAHYQTIAIAVCYLLVLMMVLTQAYALRLRRRIAEYFYPERENERLFYIYTATLKKRKTLFQFLKGIIKQKQREAEAKQKVSLRVFLAERYPCIRKVFKFLKINTEIKYNTCLGCDSENDGTLQQCQGVKCPGVYCEECLKVTQNCAICDERSEDNDYVI